MEENKNIKKLRDLQIKNADNDLSIRETELKLNAERKARLNERMNTFLDNDYSKLNIRFDNKSYILQNWDRLNNPSLDKQLELEQEITELRRKLKSTFTELNEIASDKDSKIDELNNLKRELQSKEKINHILPRISEEARQKLLNSEEFRNLFQDAKSCDSVVISIDIRRSTELMLKARKPELFSKFITDLSQKLSEIIISNFGIFDKFTGDGILAFFPKFYSGEDAIIRALKAAEECHIIFEKHYNDSRECFNVFIKDIGLGIGIDYGNITLVNTRNELTVVGIPVVYACRMSGAKAGNTILNQPAKEEILRVCKQHLKIIETEIDIKNEGTALAYKVEINETAYELPNPEWAISEEGKTK